MPCRPYVWFTNMSSNAGAELHAVTRCRCSSSSSCSGSVVSMSPGTTIVAPAASVPKTS